MDRLSDVIDVAVRGLRDEIGVEEAVSRLNAIRRDLAAESEPRDEFQRSVERDSDVDALRAQVADLTRERDANVSSCISLGTEVAELRATLAARDATIAEARVLLTEVDTGRLKGQWMPRRDAWLAGTLAGATDDDLPDPLLEAYNRGAREQRSQDESSLTSLRAEVKRFRRDLDEAGTRERVLASDCDAARAKVARLEGLRARCEAWLAWWRYGSAGANPEPSDALLADLRAGQPADDPAAESTATTIQYQRKKIEGLRAKVARLEGLRARSKAFLEWFYEAGIANDDGRALLADLRAGRSS